VRPISIRVGCRRASACPRAADTITYEDDKNSHISTHLVSGSPILFEVGCQGDLRSRCRKQLCPPSVCHERDAARKSGREDVNECELGQCVVNEVKSRQRAEQEDRGCCGADDARCARDRPLMIAPNLQQPAS
jgi:hypothetical protein